MLALTLSFFILSLMFLLLPALVSTCKLTSSSKKKKTLRKCCFLLTLFQSSIINKTKEPSKGGWLQSQQDLGLNPKLQ